MPLGITGHHWASLGIGRTARHLDLEKVGPLDPFFDEPQIGGILGATRSCNHTHTILCGNIATWEVR